VLAEIGVWHGVNSVNFRKVMSADGTLILVDPFPRKWFGIRGFGWARLIAHREVDKIKRGTVVWIEDLGCKAPQYNEVKQCLPLDFLFIDGDHSYDGLRDDWYAWKKHLAKDGIVALHDSRQRNNCGSEKFTNDVILKDKNLKVLKVVDSLTVLQLS